MKNLTKKQVEEMFKENILPAVKERFEKNGVIDHPARAEAWNDYTDSLQKDGSISSKQYSSWSNPY